MAKAKKTTGSSTIALNKKAKFDYALGDRFEAGIVLEGWEVKSARAGKVQLTDSYVLIKDGEAFLLGVNITPLPTASTHVVPDAQRTRKLLLHDSELAKLHSAVSQKGFTCVCPAMYWKGHLIKCEIALAKGKAQHDKRETEKERDWQREKQRTMAVKNR